LFCCQQQINKDPKNILEANAQHLFAANSNYFSSAACPRSSDRLRCTAGAESDRTRGRRRRRFVFATATATGEISARLLHTYTQSTIFVGRSAKMDFAKIFGEIGPPTRSGAGLPDGIFWVFWEYLVLEWKMLAYFLPFGEHCSHLV
jgi:hypothetical protein